MRRISVNAVVVAIGLALGLTVFNVGNTRAAEAIRPPTQFEVGIPADAGVVFWLSWQDNATNEASYSVERSSTGDAGPWSQIASLPPDASRYDDRVSKSA